MKVSSIVANVEYIKEGWSDSKSPEAWKTLFDEKKAARLKAPDPESPTRIELGKLQDQGLGRKMDELAKADLVGKV